MVLQQKKGANWQANSRPFFWLYKRSSQAGSAPRACAMTVAKIALSFIARSAMVLRSSSIPASFVPWMNCE